MTDSKQAVFDSCNLLADYSQVGSDPMLPFIITLNLTNSRLEPAAGESQRFCYDVTAVGQPGEDYAGLTQLVLGLCDEITAAEIAAVSVSIDGQAQEVEFGPGGNVALRTAAAPDPVSGCAGLAFYFPLPPEDSQMQLCFELREPRPVGPVGVCLSGGGLTLNGLDICGPAYEEPDQPLPVYYRADVCTPVSVTPFVTADEPQVTLCGEAEITLGDTCTGAGDSCGFTVRQQLCIAVPLRFGAVAEAGSSSTDCLAASSADICAGCGQDEEQGVINRRGFCGN